MSRDSFRYLIVVALLALSLAGVGLFVWLPGQREMPASGAGFVFLSDIDNWQQTDLRRLVHTAYDFSLGPNLHELPLTLGNWEGVDIPQSNIEVFILLEPDEYLYRLYRNDQGYILWLSLIGSTKSKSFHPPQICYSADGWQTQVSSAGLTLSQGEVFALRLDASRDDQRHVVTYFYLWPDMSRDPTKGTVLFKVTAPLLLDSMSKEDGFLLIQDFVSHIFLQGEKT